VSNALRRLNSSRKTEKGLEKDDEGGQYILKTYIFSMRYFKDNNIIQKTRNQKEEKVITE